MNKQKIVMFQNMDRKRVIPEFAIDSPIQFGKKKNAFVLTLAMKML